ncbi:MAG: sulfite exporter TauE/SafE family protein [Magnetococcales bacterium]|nr:sulfite exporter TauE/SafE family protein [Magnetococcales bacterium]
MFPTPIDLWLVFVTALLASGHCIGMCGGMVTALTLHTSGSPVGVQQSSNFMGRHLFYGISRLSTYLLLGGISGWLGSMAPSMGRSPILSALPLLIAGIGMIAMGLETWGVWQLKIPLVNQWLAGMEQKTTGENTWKKPVALGILTGLLPCGLHWAFQAKAFATGSIAGGLLILIAFGVGTLPAMLGLGWVIHLMGNRVRKNLQAVAATVVIGMGVMALIKGIQKAGLIH